MEIQHRLELMRLLSAQCDGQLEDAEQTRLEELLSGDAEARVVYLHYVDMHARLLVHPGMVEASAVPAAQGRPETSAEPVLARLAVTRAKPAEPARPPLQRGVRQVLPYLGVMAATVAATLLVQVLIGRLAFGPAAAPEVVRDLVEAPPYLATVTQSADAEWDELRQSGSRLMPGEVRLKKGVARIHLDSGADFVMVGPTTLRLESITEASLVLGKVTFRADEAAVPFTLSTPTSLLIESGTACGIEVKSDRDEVHVFEGAVQRLPKDASDEMEPQLLAAGEARKYSTSSLATGEATSLDKSRFVRDLPVAPKQAGEGASGLLAYEPFDYQDADAIKNKQAEGGLGWAGSWELRPMSMGWGFPGKGGPDRGPPRSALNIESGLGRGDAAVSGGMLEVSDSVTYRRMLANPIRLDADGVYYLSFLLRRDHYDEHSSMSLTLKQTQDPNEDQNRDKGDPKQNRGGFGGRHGFSGFGPMGRFGHMEQKEIYLRLAGNRPTTESPFGGFENNRARGLPLSDGETYLFVAKVVASAANANQIFLRVYTPDETLGPVEPDDWSYVGRQFRANYVLDRLDVGFYSFFGRENKQAIDELRLGTTWSSVIGPWIRQPVANPPSDGGPAADSKAETK